MLVSWIPPNQFVTLEDVKGFTDAFSIENTKRIFGDDCAIHGNHFLDNIGKTAPGFSTKLIEWSRSFPVKSVHAVSVSLPPDLPTLTRMAISTLVMVTQVLGMDVRLKETRIEMLGRLRVLDPS